MEGFLDSTFYFKIQILDIRVFCKHPVLGCPWGQSDFGGGGGVPGGGSWGGWGGPPRGGGGGGGAAGGGGGGGRGRRGGGGGDFCNKTVLGWSKLHRKIHFLVCPGAPGNPGRIPPHHRHPPPPTPST